MQAFLCSLLLSPSLHSTEPSHFEIQEWQRKPLVEDCNLGEGKVESKVTYFEESWVLKEIALVRLSLSLSAYVLL